MRASSRSARAVSALVDAQGGLPQDRLNRPDGGIAARAARGIAAPVVPGAEDQPALRRPQRQIDDRIAVERAAVVGNPAQDRDDAVELFRLQRQALALGDDQARDRMAENPLRQRHFADFAVPALAEIVLRLEHHGDIEAGPAMRGQIAVEAPGGLAAAADRRVDGNDIGLAGPGDIDADLPDIVIVLGGVIEPDVLACGRLRVLGPGDFRRQVGRHRNLPAQGVARALANLQLAAFPEQELALPARPVERPEGEALPPQRHGRPAPAAVKLQQEPGILRHDHRGAVMGEGEHARLQAGIVRRRQPGLDRHRRGGAALEIGQEGAGETVRRIAPARAQAQSQQNDGKTAQRIRIAPGDPRPRRPDPELAQRGPGLRPVTLPERFGKRIAGADREPVEAGRQRPVIEAAGPLQPAPGRRDAGQAQAAQAAHQGNRQGKAEGGQNGDMEPAGQQRQKIGQDEGGEQDGDGRRRPQAGPQPLPDQGQPGQPGADGIARRRRRPGPHFPALVRSAHGISL